MIPKAKIVRGKANVASINKAGGSEPRSRGFMGWSRNRIVRL